MNINKNIEMQEKMELGEENTNCCLQSNDKNSLQLQEKKTGKYLLFLREELEHYALFYELPQILMSMGVPETSLPETTIQAGPRTRAGGQEENFKGYTPQTQGKDTYLC